MSNLKNDTKLFVLGRTRGGKDTLARYISELFGLRILCSYSDREMRDYETNGVEHIFITEEAMTELLEREEIFAFTGKENINARYCSTMRQVEACDIYIIDPKGLQYVREHPEKVPNYKTIGINVDYTTRLERAIAAGDDIEIFKERDSKENSQFTEFFEAGECDLLIYNYDLENSKKLIREFVEPLLK